MKRFLLLTLMVCGTVFAEMGNHYILGSHGLLSAVKPLCGFEYTGILTDYHAHCLKGKNGKKLKLPCDEVHHLDVCFLQNYFSYYTPLCLFGGKYGFQVNIPFAYTAMDVIVFKHSFEVEDHFRLADIYLEPINLRYSWSQFDLFLAYGVYIPTGTAKPYCLKNSGYGNFGNLLTAAGTVFFDCAHTWSFSAYVTYEIHGNKRHCDFTPGNNLCVDWGLGKTFGRYFALGLVGYYEQQTTCDRGKVPHHFDNAKDMVWAFGGEFDVIVPQINFELTLRYLQECGAYLRTEGGTFVVVANLAF